MNAAFKFFSCPSSGTGIAARCRKTGTRFAANTEIALLVQWNSLDALLLRIVEDIAPLPIRQRADFQNLFAAGQLVLFDLLQMCSRGRLFSAQASEPHVKVFERAHQRLHFADLAAARGIKCEQPPE